jgi:hypothetical protein
MHRYNISIKCENLDLNINFLNCVKYISYIFSFYLKRFSSNHYLFLKDNNTKMFTLERNRSLYISHTNLMLLEKSIISPLEANNFHSKKKEKTFKNHHKFYWEDGRTNRERVDGWVEKKWKRIKKTTSLIFFLNQVANDLDLHFYCRFFEAQKRKVKT